MKKALKRCCNTKYCQICKIHRFWTQGTCRSQKHTINILMVKLSLAEEKRMTASCQPNTPFNVFAGNQLRKIDYYRKWCQPTVDKQFQHILHTLTDNNSNVWCCNSKWKWRWSWTLEMTTTKCTQKAYNKSGNMGKPCVQESQKISSWQILRPSEGLVNVPNVCANINSLRNLNRGQTSNDVGVG